jgi:DNA-binding CsgD family transcriptional regulator
LILLRAGDSPAFTPGETTLVGQLAPTIATSLRRTLVRQHLDHASDAGEAGILVVGGEPLMVLAATDAARSWLDELDDGGMASGLPTCVSSAVHASRRRPEQPVVVRARTRAGRWVSMTAERITVAGAGGEPGDHYGVVVQPSRPAEIATIIGAAHRLTPRESDVVVLVAAGRTNREIAQSLALSPHTVSDHLKSIFTKLDVASRGEMTSKLFHDHYLPREIDGAPVGHDGWYLTT